ncbi:MAG: protein translocase subunit SecD [Planctomycetota bacterium]
MMRNRLGWALLAMALLAFAIYGFMPPAEKLRTGKDLAGGVTLTYSVQIDPGQNAEDTLNQLITVLKQRIDPTNQLDISIVPVGRDRIEITMPLPSDRVKGLRADFETRLDDLRGYTIDPTRLERLVAEPADQRRGSIASIRERNPQLADRLEAAAAAYDRLAEADAAYRGILGQEDPPQDDVDRLEANAAIAELDYEAARDEALELAVRPEEVRRILELSRETTRKIDEQTDRAVELPSPFQRAWRALYARAGGRDIEQQQADESIAGSLSGESGEQDDGAPAADATALQRELDEISAAYDAYTSERRSLDDPQDLKRLLRGAGELDFRITVNPNTRQDETALREQLQEVGPRNASPEGAVWLRIAKIENWFESVDDLRAITENAPGYFTNRGFVVEEYDGQYWMLAWDQVGNRLTSSEGDWQVTRSYTGSDSLGRPAIVFQMDALGSQQLGELTGEHVGENMAVVLDDRVITAPRLRGRISSNGQIEGDFSQEELRYIIQVLNAGSLQARLSPEPISETTIGPSLGQDNLEDGMNAGVFALIAVSIFMVIYYFGYGLIAVIALACNAALILGAMAHNQSAFTMPGIAGVVLTFGMAVDANVLIFERIREELRKGLDLAQSAKLGYQKALSSIVDGNITNLIVCVVLGGVGTQEVKGFAITLGIGVVCTMISALIISRLILSLMIDDLSFKALGQKATSMLPTAVPVIERVLEPRINWMGLRFIPAAISLIGISFGILMIVRQGEKMLDTEFVGGTQVVLKFGINPETDEPFTMTRKDVLDRVQGLGEAASEGDPLELLKQADVLPFDPQADGVTSDTFQIKTLVTNSELLQEAIVPVFDDVLDVRPPLAFDQRDEENARAGPVFPIAGPEPLGAHIRQPQYRDDVGAYIGGAAIVIAGLEPGETIAGIEERLDQLRGQSQFSETLGREREIRVLERHPDGSVQAAVVLVVDQGVSYFADRDRWWQDVGQTEWTIVREALAVPTTLASVNSFSPAIAGSFRAKAAFAVVLSFVLITIYIWVRFGSVRYSVAAILTLLHDVLIALGLIAAAEVAYEFAVTEDIAQALNILPFRIDLNTVAAILTIIGYSLNDTIIIMDRIRENRGKLPYAGKRVINLSINQTISRTVITSGTTLFAVGTLYVLGGEGLRPFAYALLIGVIVGTYSSIAIAAPLVWSRKADPTAKPADDPGAAGIGPSAAGPGAPQPM